jgi:recombination protein RecA
MSAPAPANTLHPDKAKALQAALSQIEKQFGKGTIMRLGNGKPLQVQGDNHNENLDR